LMVLLIDVIEHEIANEIQKTSNNLQRNYWFSCVFNKLNNICLWESNKLRHYCRYSIIWRLLVFSIFESSSLRLDNLIFKGSILRLAIHRLA
jgi:hypothetical protein